MNIETTLLLPKHYQRVSQWLDAEKRFSYLPDAFTPLWSVTPDGVPKALWAIHCDDELVGAAGYVIAETDRKLACIGLIVAPAYRQQGIGSHIITALLEALHKRGIQRVLSKVYTEQAAGQRLLARHGFCESGRSILAQCSVADAQVAEWDNPDEIVARQGLHFATLDHFPRWGLAERLLPIWNRTRPDQPQDWPYPPYSAQRFEEEMFESGEIALPHSYAIVSARQQIVALMLNVLVSTKQTSKHLFTVYSAVDPDFRRQRLGTALKLKLINHARTHGIPFLTTENDRRNIAMWQINRNLGYQQLTDLVTYELGIRN